MKNTFINMRLGVARLALMACLSSVLAGPATAQTLLEALNSVRARGCGSLPTTTVALRLDPRLSAAAARTAAGTELAEALKAAAYRSPRSTLIALRGYTGAQAIAQGAAGYSCQTVMATDFKEMGFYAKGQSVWIVLAAPFSPPLATDQGEIEARVLYLVNQARGLARSCGNEAMAAVQPVRLNTRLRSASAAHAVEMARYNYFSHTGRDGFHVSERANRAGYAWRAIGENIASGQMNANVAVQGWLKSPTHCANLMMPSYTEMGLAFAVNPQSDGGVYWVQVFGLPK